MWSKSIQMCAICARSFVSFMTEESTTTNPDLKAAVGKGLSVIKQHTEMIDNIAHMGGIQTPPMPAGA
jgi:hypothetical protein